ncbi:hypothetical protein ACIQ9Q_24845 [Streptomyces sp. NPDC094438]|uniref:Vgb family protein n=1 Tax=Streptomyces sp. NPDC094438 TaxID=3366061 RepID=UPI003804A692
MSLTGGTSNTWTLDRQFAPGQVAVDESTGTVWMIDRASAQLLRLDTASGKTCPLPLPDGAPARHLLTTPGGTLWFTTAGTRPALCRLGAGDFGPVVWDYPPGEQPDGLAIGPEGTIWVALAGSHRIEQRTPVGELEKTYRAGPAVSRLAVTDSLVWFTTADGSAGFFVPATGRSHVWPMPTAGSHATDVAVTKDGAAWFATAGRGLLARLPAPGEPAVHRALAGGDQLTGPGEVFGTPLAVAVLDTRETPLARREVVFDIDTAASASFPGDSHIAVVTTDTDGIATAPRISAGARRGWFHVRTRSADLAVPADFLLAIGPVTATVEIRSGNGQVRPPGAIFDPLVVRLTADGPVPEGVPVTFSVTSGDVAFPSGARTARATTASDGTATSPELRAGDTRGNATVAVTAWGTDATASFTLRVR